MQIDSDLVIYRTTLLRTFQVVTICRVDKSEVLVVLTMSLFDLQDDRTVRYTRPTGFSIYQWSLIGIYGLKGPYCTLTTTNWFLQALSVIPRGSWGDVARRSYHDPVGKSGIVIPEPQWLWAHG
ncbi:omega-hydroxypalmitate O-feruloyl transferase [Dorcoceras hygrometricum]|uniref:Omega-hydroxypalmitate O-feruloyl transferase n=1 Tax=Dorcoceras hygrometricum TaxID=472368 RepID=A0A2Z7CEQ9_9LAMI|nr:omega-hydroxypalmitate O-feruloyl transferase [Dorcoceras hygrometricum]